jgi:hypothetical protein
MDADLDTPSDHGYPLRPPLPDECEEATRAPVSGPAGPSRLQQELIDYSPSLGDKVARSTATHTIVEIAAEIIEVIRGT